MEDHGGALVVVEQRENEREDNHAERVEQTPVLFTIATV